MWKTATHIYNQVIWTPVNRQARKCWNIQKRIVRSPFNFFHKNNLSVIFVAFNLFIVWKDVREDQETGKIERKKL